MKRIAPEASVLGILFLSLGYSLACEAQTRTLTILHANDTHSHMFPFRAGAPDPVGKTHTGSGIRELIFGIRRAGLHLPDRDSGGIARMSTLIRKLRAANRDVLALHGGDVFVGSFEFNKSLGYAELKIMEGLYDAMALGNHEFDLGLGGLARILSGEAAGDAPVDLPVLCANVNFSGTALETKIKPSIVRTIGGIKVGVFGLVTEAPQHYSAEVAARMSGRVYEVAGAQAAALRSSGCELVICLSHLGAMADLTRLAKVPGIDVIVGGHSHDAFENPILLNGKIVVQAGMFGLCLGELRVKLEDGAVGLDRYRLHKIDGRIKEDPRLKGRLKALREGIVEDPRFGPVYTQGIAWAARDIEKTWPESGTFRDTPLGNLVTDAIMAGLEKAGIRADFALEALGYIAYKVPRGKVVGNDVLRTVPYGYDAATGLGYKIVLVPLPGSLILAGLEHTLSAIPYSKEFFIQACGLTYQYDSTKPASTKLGALSRLDPMSVLANGEPVAANPDKRYLVAMNEQVFLFLSSLAAPLGLSLVSFPTGASEYDVVRDHMKDLEVLDNRAEGRIRDVPRQD